MAGVLAVTAMASGCGTDGDDAVGGNANSPDTVTGYVREWKVAADHTTIKAGEVTFSFTNKGSIGHELLVIRTDLPVGKIPGVPRRRFDGEGGFAGGNSLLVDLADVRPVLRE